MTFYATSPFVSVTEPLSEDPTQLRYQLTQSQTDMGNAINQREIGNFLNTETVTGKQFFDPTNPQVKKPVFRIVISTGAIAIGATATLAHGITGITQVTHLYGAVTTSAPDFRPLPFVSSIAVGNQASLRATSTSIIIVSGAGMAAITAGYVVMEYLKN